jgi:hypothetical protein
MQAINLRVGDVLGHPMHGAVMVKKIDRGAVRADEPGVICVTFSDDKSDLHTESMNGTDEVWPIGGGR